MEELDNLEETLNESIRESVGARTGKGTHSKKKGAFEEEDDAVIRYSVFQITFIMCQCN
jgi:acetyl-CoA carboxylase carboxyltransferase component